MSLSLSIGRAMHIMHLMPNFVQQMAGLFDGELRTLELPPPEKELMPGVHWGAFDELLTPAFWAGRAWLHSTDPSFLHCRLGRSLKEEVAACLLGGYGIPAEVGLAAYRELRDRDLLGGTPSPQEIQVVLTSPLKVGGRLVRYRFARQKAEYLSDCLRCLGEMNLPTEDQAFRDALTSLPGIGMKTASWITRNMRGSDRVAILDVHICRACSVIGVFPKKAEPAKDYRALETRFLEFAGAVSTRASLLDSVMWHVMRRIGSALARRVNNTSVATPELVA